MGICHLVETMRRGWKKGFCKGCNTQLPWGRPYCDICIRAQELGVGWNTVFDRDAGVGRIPRNLIEQYGLKRSGRAAA